jgi:hypothetical protein
LSEDFENDEHDALNRMMQTLAPRAGDLFLLILPLTKLGLAYSLTPHTPIMTDPANPSRPIVKHLVLPGILLETFYAI